MRWHSLLALLAAGCQAEPQAPPDSSRFDDLAGLVDLAPSSDLATPPDLSAPPDLAPSPDLAAPPDFAAPPDLTAPPDLLPSTGLVWPPSQQFPSFGPISTLDVIDLTTLPADQQTLCVTLAGLINRARPRIYTEDDGGEGKTFWLDRLNATTTTFTDPFALVAKYRSELAGIVIYDPALADTLNLATTIASLKGAVVASPAVAATLGAAPTSLPTLADLRTNHFAAKTDVYQYELDHFAPSASHRLIVGLDPSIAGHLRDYAMATQAMMVWLDPRVPAEQTLLSSFLALLPPSSPYLGWWADEPSGVHAASAAGVPTFAADWSSNLSVLGGSPRFVPVPSVTPAPPPLENKLYVAIFMSDGDNVQEDQHLIPMKWADGQRGQVPIAWTIDPALVDVAPVILSYFRATATSNDVLVSGPSGLGYTYPAAWPANVFDGYAQISGRYLTAAGLDVITVWNNGVDLSTANLHSYAADMPGLLGLTIQDETQPLQLADGWLPVLKLAVSYGDSESALESGIDGALAGFTHAAPAFVAVQGDMNIGVITPTAFSDVQQHYAANSDVVFVRPDHFFRLLRMAQQPAQHIDFTGDFDGDGKSDALFYYGGDGHWWMGLSDGTKLTWHQAADLSAVGNLVDGHHAFYTGDFDGNGKADVLIQGSDGSWRLGLSDGTQLSFSIAASTSGFGDLLDGAHRTFVGDFTGDGKSDVLFYYSGDGNWWLGTSSGSAFSFANAGSTSGFGNLGDGSHALYAGDFTGDGKSDVAFFYNGDDNWWMGVSDGSKLTWHGAGNVSGFGNLIDRGHRLHAGDFDGDGKRDLAFYYEGDGNWWMGLSDGSGFNWHQAATTTAHLADWSHRELIGDFDGNHKADVAVYDSDDGSWSVGLSDGSHLVWHSAGTSAAIGNLVDPTRLLSVGDLDGDGKSDLLSYGSADGNWRMALSDGTTFQWHLAGNVSGFGDLTR
jgi:hypothetical protein